MHPKNSRTLFPSIDTTPIVSSLRFHNSTRRLRSKCELVYFLSRSITSRLPFFSFSFFFPLIIVALPPSLVFSLSASIELLIPPRSNVKITTRSHLYFLTLFCSDDFWFVYRNWTNQLDIDKPRCLRQFAKIFSSIQFLDQRPVSFSKHRYKLFVIRCTHSSTNSYFSIVLNFEKVIFRLFG